MKSRWWTSLFRFQKTERTGIVALLPVVFVILVLVKTATGIWMDTDSKSILPGNAITEAWEAYKLAHTQPVVKEEMAAIPNPILFAFDPNTIDSLDLLKLGLRPKTAYFLLNWRRKGKVFYKKEDLKKLYTLSEAEYTRLEPYILISSAPNNRFSDFGSQYKNEPLPAVISLNTADSSLLVRLNGIGPTLAHKISDRRKSLGGFLKHEQLLEVYRFPDSTYKMLKEKLLIDPSQVQKLKMNTASFEQLAAHPYIGEKMAKNIILLREGMKRFDNLEQLRQVPLMDEEKYRKLAPYISLD